MRVVVSGIPGDVTSWVIDELARRGHEVTEGSPKPQWLSASSRGGRSCGAAVDALVHIAPPGDDAADVNAMVDAAKRAAVPRVVVISSALAPWSATEELCCDGDPLWRTDTSRSVLDGQIFHDQTTMTVTSPAADFNHRRTTCGHVG